MTAIVVGYGCAALCVVALVAALWWSALGDTKAGQIAFALAFALLFTSLVLLRARENRL